MGRPAQPSNFFLRPSIPLSASMFLRQSPTSRFSWGGWNQRLRCLPGPQSLKYAPPALQPVGHSVLDACPRILFWNISFPLNNPIQFSPSTSCLSHALPVSPIHFLTPSCTSCLLAHFSSCCTPCLLLVSLMHFLIPCYFLSP